MKKHLRFILATVVALVGMQAWAQPLYTSLGEICDYDYAYPYTNAFTPQRDVVVESYDDCFIIRGWAGTEGYDLKVVNGVYGNIESVTPIYNGVEQATVTEAVATVQRDAESTFELALIYSMAEDTKNEAEGGYALFYNMTDNTYYCIMWPQEDEVTPDPEPTSQFDHTKVYTLSTPRGYLPVSADTRDLWGQQYVVAVSSADEAGKFQILGSEGAYTILNVEAGKYLAANGDNQHPYVDEPDGTFTIYPATNVENGREGAWIIKSNENECWMMFGGSGEYRANDSWAVADDGDQWTITEAGDAPVVETPLYTAVGRTEANADFAEFAEPVADFEQNVQLEVYEGYVIVRNFLGVDDYDVKFSYMYDEETEMNLVVKTEALNDPEDAGDGMLTPSVLYGTLYFAPSAGYVTLNDNQSGNLTFYQVYKMADQGTQYYYHLVWGDKAEGERPAITPEEGEYASLETFTLNFGQAVTLPEEDWEHGIYFVPTGAIEGVDNFTNEGVMLSLGENEGEVIVTTWSPIVSMGQYTLTIFEGAVILADGSNCAQYVYHYSVDGSLDTTTTEEGETSFTITPADGSELTKIDHLELTLSGYINPTESWEEQTAFYDAEGNQVAIASWDQEGWDADENGDFHFTLDLDEPISEAGTYTLKFTFENLNEKWTTLGVHAYEVTYKVDGSESPTLLATYTDGRTGRDESWEETRNDEDNTELVYAEVITDITVELWSNSLVIKGWAGVEGYDLRFVLDEDGDIVGVQNVVNGSRDVITSWKELQTGREDVASYDASFFAADEWSNATYTLLMDSEGGRLTFKMGGYDAEWNLLPVTYYSIAWGKGADAINGVQASTGNATIYNVSGQQLRTLQRGINIVGGRKVVF